MIVKRMNQVKNLNLLIFFLIMMCTNLMGQSIKKDNSKNHTDTLEIIELVGSKKQIRKINKNNLKYGINSQRVIKVFELKEMEIYEFINPSNENWNLVFLLYKIDNNFFYFKEYEFEYHKKRINEILLKTHNFSESEIREICTYIQYKIFWNSYWHRKETSTTFLEKANKNE